MFTKLPYDVLRDLVPITRLVAVPNVMVINPNLGVSTMAQMVVLAKSKPGKVGYDSAGQVSEANLMGELFNATAQVQLLHVPYRGSAQAIQDAMDGTIDAVFDNLPSSLPFIQSGKLKALAVASTKRLALLPDVPTFAEVGLAPVNESSWFGPVAPAKTPADIVLRIQAAAAKILAMPEVHTTLANLGSEPVGNTPEEFTAQLRSELVKFKRVADGADIKLDEHSVVQPQPTSAKYRVLIGQICQESHGFTPLETHLPAFVIETGQSLISCNENADFVLGGLIRTGLQEGWELIPSIAARASPGGQGTDDAYAFTKQHFMTAALKGGFDPIALGLHGCMQTLSLDSAEAELLQSLRAVAGNSIPIVAGFDLHAHANAGMLAHLSFASAYKTNPHADPGHTGQRVGRTLSGILNGRLQPMGCAASVAMLTGGNDETASAPLLELHRLASDRVAANHNLLDASIFNVNPFVDGKAVGQTALVYARSAVGLPAACELATDIANTIVAKSGYHFKLGFGSYSDCICVATPGLTLYEPQSEHFKQARPLYPLDDFEFTAAAANLPVFS